ncbi:zinc finger CCCH domain-containing protein 13-like [Amphibalanus amphitrite]|uniref:zinc finger CCCH domain-containing protein 13-like n=1 Tax=Amphibalanus amphitrite TaxID=1232801 RepID=UPI001C8FB561|nr:zinc finger CCCH domain-containing protein 13-like [Amphibalanus amphitrite]
MMDSQNHSVASASPPTSAPLPATPAPAPTIIVYPTVSPETVIIPIISSIVVFPAAAFTVICCLRYRAKRARRRAKQPRLGDRSDRNVPVIRIDGSRKPETGVKGGKPKKRDSHHTNELHYTSATVFQAVLGIDLDLDERSEWENEVMGYTSVRGMSSPTSSMGSLQGCPAHNSVQPRIIQMEMSPRAARSTRSSPGRGPDLPPAHVTAVTDIWRRPLEPLQRNGRPPGTLAELPRRASDGAEDFGRKWNGHGPPDLLQLRRLGGTQTAGSDRNGTVLGERATPPTPPQGETKREDEREDECEKRENGSEERENQIEERESQIEEREKQIKEREDQSSEEDQSVELKDQSDELEDQSEREYESKERSDSNELREEQSAKREEESEEREDHGEEREERSEVEDSWHESLRFIDDSSEAS